MAPCPRTPSQESSRVGAREVNFPGPSAILPATPMAPQALLRDLGDGLTLRAATAADAESLATFVGDTLRAQDGEAPDHHLADWTRDLLDGRHPSFTPADATVVTDTRTGEIVSCLHLLSQTWSYGGVPISVGQPELIGTRTARRGHGLVQIGRASCRERALSTAAGGAG